MTPLKQTSPNHPFVSLVFLLLFAFAGAVIFTLVGIGIGAVLYGTAPLMQLIAQQPVSEIGFLKIMQITSTFGMFLVPALIIAKMDTHNWMLFLKFYKPNSTLLIITIGIMIVFIPLLEGSIRLNQEMKLPVSLKWLEDWMRQQEEQMAELTKQFLIMKTFGAFVLNFLMIAVLPAIEEEVFFRGTIQKLLGRWSKNPHLAIWITAVVFSAIHMQFYGFIPRMLLGALFGYLFFWSKTIWVPILAHLLNNGITVTAAYIYQTKGIPLDKLDETTTATWPLYAGSAILTAAAIYLFYKEARKLKYLNYGRELG